MTRGIPNLLADRRACNGGGGEVSSREVAERGGGGYYRNDLTD